MYPRRAAHVATSLTSRKCSTTARTMNALRIANANFLYCKTPDEIRAFCIDGILLLSPRDEKFPRARMKFCSDSARACDICTGKNNFQNLPRKRCARTGIDQKMSESVPSDSRRACSPVENLCATVRADFISRRTICCRSRRRDEKMPHCTQNGFRHAHTAARVRG